MAEHAAPKGQFIPAQGIDLGHLCKKTWSSPEQGALIPNVSFVIDDTVPFQKWLALSGLGGWGRGVPRALPWADVETRLWRWEHGIHA